MNKTGPCPADYIAAGFDPPHWDERPLTPAVLSEQLEIEEKVRALKTLRERGDR